MKSKFKVGDKVQIIKKFSNTSYTHWVPPMEKTINKKGIIISITSKYRELAHISYCVCFKNNRQWQYTSESLKLLTIPYKKIIKRIIDEKI